MEEQNIQTSNAKSTNGMHPIIAVFLIWLSCILIGYVIGRIQSPDFSKKRLVEDYFEKKSTYFRYSWGDFIKDLKPIKLDTINSNTSKPSKPIGSNLNPKNLNATKPDTVTPLSFSTLLALFPDHPAVWVAFEKNIYIYRGGGDSIQIVERNNLDYTPRGNGFWNVSKEQFEKYLLPSGALSGMTITKYYSLAEEVAINAGNKKKWVQWGLKILYIAGFGIGYNLGYEGQPMPDNVFVAEVLHDRENWKSIIERKEYKYNKIESN